MGGPALARPALVLYHGLQPRVKPRGAGAPRSTGLGRQGRSRLRTKAILLDPDRGNDAGMSRSVPRADRDGVAGAPPLRCGGMRPAAGGDTEGAESRAALMGARQSRAATAARRDPAPSRLAMSRPRRAGKSPPTPPAGQPGPLGSRTAAIAATIQLLFLISVSPFRSKESDV